jgi:hypothetical protein
VEPKDKTLPTIPLRPAVVIQILDKLGNTNDEKLDLTQYGGGINGHDINTVGLIHAWFILEDFIRVASENINYIPSEKNIKNSIPNDAVNERIKKVSESKYAAKNNNKCKNNKHKCSCNGNCKKNTPEIEFKNYINRLKNENIVPESFVRIINEGHGNKERFEVIDNENNKSLGVFVLNEFNPIKNTFTFGNTINRLVIGMDELFNRSITIKEYYAPKKEDAEKNIDKNIDKVLKELGFDGEVKKIDEKDIKEFKEFMKDLNNLFLEWR